MHSSIFCASFCISRKMSNIESIFGLQLMAGGLPLDVSPKMFWAAGLGPPPRFPHDGVNVNWGRWKTKTISKPGKQENFSFFNSTRLTCDWHSLRHRRRHDAMRQMFKNFARFIFMLIRLDHCFRYKNKLFAGFTKFSLLVDYSTDIRMINFLRSQLNLYENLSTLKSHKFLCVKLWLKSM